MNESSEIARRSLATAARALDEFRRLSGAPGAADPPPSDWRVPAEAGARAALVEARARIAALEEGLEMLRRAEAAAAETAEAERREAASAHEAELTAARGALQAEFAAARGDLEAELAAAREALEAALGRERRSEEAVAAERAAWTARMDLLERETLSAARAEARRELAEAQARGAALESELEASRGAAAALEAEARGLREAAEKREAARTDFRSNAEDAQRRAAESSSRIALLEAECVRLEKLRRAADQAAADAESQGRAVAETLRREVRAANSALDRAAVEAGAAEAKARTEAETLRTRLEAASSRLQALERERRLEQARGTGESSATQTELLRAQAVAAALRQELSGVRAEEAVLRRRTAEAQAALERAAADRPAELERAMAEVRAAQDQVAGLQKELLGAQALAASLRRELSVARAAAAREEEALRRRSAEAQEAFERTLAERPPREEPRPLRMPPPEDAAPGKVSDAPEAVEPAPFVMPTVEPLLDPAWARLVRLVRPPVDSAYAHLRRLSGTALTTGQKALMRMAAASIAQASDSLSSIELTLEEGPAPSGPAPVIPLLEASLAAWESAFRGRGASISRDFAPHLPESAFDPKELRIAFHHVLRNVLEAVPRGGKLALRAWRAQDGSLRIEFADDGPGFPADWLARRFEPFAAARRGRAGLGLALVRRTLRRWGGDAEASNGPSGRGARLTLIFAPPPSPSPPVK